jgi:anti-sigma factor RsiW
MQHQEAVDTLACERYLLGEMTAAERESFEEHYFACAECADDVRAGAAMKDGVRAGFIKAKSEPKPTPRWRPTIVLPWAAAASLAIVAGYETVRMRPASSFDRAPLALAPVTLRTATRGQETVASRGPGGAVTLAIDLAGEPMDQGVEYELRSADGARVAGGRAPAPSPGAPLLLVVPPGLLDAGRHYVVVVRNPQKPDLTPEEYRFSVEPL